MQRAQHGFDMELAIQPCVPCAELHGQPSTAEMHADLRPLTLAGSDTARATEHYRCRRCHAEFVRVLEGRESQTVWMLINAGQH